MHNFTNQNTNTNRCSFFLNVFCPKIYNLIINLKNVNNRFVALNKVTIVFMLLLGLIENPASSKTGYRS